MKISTLSLYLEKLEQESSRNVLTEHLASLFLDHSLSTEETAPVLYFLQSRIAPSYEPIEFNMSDKAVLSALSNIAEKYKVEFEPATELKSKGDIGLVCETLLLIIAKRGTINSEALNISAVHSALFQITQTSGAGSQQQKQQLLANLLIQLDPLSGRYIARIVTGNLRLGLSDKTIFDALSWSIDGSKKHREEIEQAYGARADLGHLATLVKQSVEASEDESKRIEELNRLLSNIKLTVGTPVASKLCEREDSAESVFKRLGACVLQPKLDGMRAQIHYDKAKGIKQVFSRNQESLTESFPDILEALDLLNCNSCIIDSEVVGYDYESDSYLSYHETMTRRRKHDVDETASKVPLRAMSFDLLYLDGEDISTSDVETRVELLRKLVESSSEQRKIAFLETVQVNTAEELEDYFQTQIGQGLEGILCKKLGTKYAPGTRNYDWIKLKANTQAELVDTVDVVVIGYFAGSGDRAKYGFGSLLTAIYDPQTDGFHSVAKVGSGFTDQLAPTMRADLESLRIDEKPENVSVNNQLKPDYWVRPEIVMEVVADEITRSPAHTAAAALKADFEPALSGKGLSLRFPRMKIWKRDKKPTQATTASELLRLFELRKQRLLNGK